jgi:uncharacterized protein
MLIELANLEDGRGEFAHVYQPEALNPIDERVKVDGPTKIEGKIRTSGTEAFISGNISTRVQVDCDRCLKQIELPVNTDFALEYITGGEYEATKVAELTEELMTVSVFDGEVIDVDEMVKEQILLSVPTRMLCKLDCRGICANCGADKNIGDCDCKTDEGDPRWAALRNLTSGK